MEGGGATGARTKRLVKDLVRKLLSECRSQQAEYALEHIVPTLIPGLVALLETHEDRVAKRSKDDGSSRELDLKPVNALASFLFRNNPRVGQSSARVERHRRLVQQVIAEEKLALTQHAALRDLARDTGAAIASVGLWPTNPASSQPEPLLSLRSAELKEVLDELEWHCGLAGLRAELQVVLETLDVRGSGTLTWPAFVDVVQHWVTLNPETRRAKPTSDFRRWLCEETLRRIEDAVSEYYGTRHADKVFAHLVQGAEVMSWDGARRFMEEIRGHVLEWDESESAGFDVADVLDGLEMKCADEIDVVTFEELEGTFLRRLARARVSALFNNVSF